MSFLFQKKRCLAPLIAGEYVIGIGIDNAAILRERMISFQEKTSCNLILYWKSHIIKLHNKRDKKKFHF